MKKIKNLINDQKGASIVLALYFLLVCSILSILIVLSGSVVVGKSINKAELIEGDNITLSCFKLLTEEISRKTFSYKKESGISYFEQDLRKDGTILLSAYIAEGYKYICDNKKDYQRDFIINIDNKNLKIKGTFSINNIFEIEINLDEIISENDEELATGISRIKFYPLTIQNNNDEVLVKMGEAEII